MTTAIATAEAPQAPLTFVEERTLKLVAKGVRWGKALSMALRASILKDRMDAAGGDGMLKGQPFEYMGMTMKATAEAEGQDRYILRLEARDDKGMITRSCRLTASPDEILGGAVVKRVLDLAGSAYRAAMFGHYGEFDPLAKSSTMETALAKAEEKAQKQEEKKSSAAQKASATKTKATEADKKKAKAA